MNKIIYLDAAATYQKSQVVVEAQVDFVKNHYANSGRGICAKSAWVDDMLIQTRTRIADFMGAENANQIIFTSGTTGAMNMIARMLNINSSKIVAVSDLDHHSARLPFIQNGAQVEICQLNECYDFDTDNIPFADVMVVTAMSNVLGRAQDVAKIITAAKQKNPNVITVVDAAQYVVHNPIDAKKWGADFVCWSGHKIGADTGLGILYMKNPNRFAPVNFGGGMVNKIVGDKIIFNNPPDVFEAGTLPLTQISGMIDAIDELEKHRPNLNLIKYVFDELANIGRVHILTERDSAICSFVVDGMHALDFGALLGARGVCVRVGNMCASWVHKLLGIDASVRISVGAYNTMDDVKTAVQYIKDILK
ncbi:MAG: aminotransferase class V-fold PLP-dependent enzyme [Alphaproteobacteria bacterium]|nr:aminotransferase class V-fold PLP-dependent enzyme [Alphaproteobacteria bacterium]